MLGLGLYIYAGEDVPQEATAPEPEPKPKAKAKAKPKAKESAKPAEPARPDPATDDNPNKVSLTLITLAGEAKSMDELTEFYKTNKSAFDRLSVSDPESHKEVIEYFTKIKNSFQ